jgi:glutamate-ammonia-ligase adenylyltransferase
MQAEAGEKTEALRERVEQELARALAVLPSLGADPALGDFLMAEIAAGPDPEHTARVTARVLEAVSAAEGRLDVADPERAGRGIARLLGAAPFFSTWLARHPDWLGRLAQDELEHERGLEEYLERLAAMREARQGDDPADWLRELKYYELARITWRDVDVVPIDRVGETLAEVSHLAEALLACAFDLAAARVSERFGKPLWRGPEGERVELAFCVLGLGKLGSEELNFSSDVDLVYVHEEPPGPLSLLDAGEGARCSDVEYWNAIGRELRTLVSASTGSGFLYRVDLDLRPEGGKGPLVICEEELLRYFEVRADLWERTAYMKARPVAGSTALGWRVLRRLQPMIFHRGMHWDAVEAIRILKERIESERSGGEDEFDVKLDRGGIRDVEFVAQSLQLLHGGRIPQLRERSTQLSIAGLAAVGVLPAEVADRLLESYRFLRRLENRIQMEGEQQRHRCPRDEDGLERLALSLGLRGGDGRSAGAVLAREIENVRERVVSNLPTMLGGGSDERILDLFARHIPKLLAHPTARRMVESLGEHFARAVDRSPEPSRALNNLDRFVSGVGSRRFYYELLFDRPELVDRLTALFSSSEYLSGYLARHPGLIEPVFDDPEVLLLDREALEQDLETLGGYGEDEETRLRALRLFHHRQMINVGLLDLDGRIERLETERSLTEIGEVCLACALDLARDQIASRSDEARQRLAESEFLVVGMGKLASGELSYGSDLDLIFLYDAPGVEGPAKMEVQELSVRLAQKLIAALQTRTADGMCYEVDTRLRPSGNQGLLVTSIDAFEHYHAESADLWERQALLRSRPVAGGEALARRFVEIRREILGRPLPDGAAQEIHRIRLRMEHELARETAVRKDLKTGRGGLTDIEHVVQLLQLRHGREHEALLATDPIEVQLERLRDLGLLEAEDARALAEGWHFLVLLSSRMRVVENRSISDLDEERGDLEGIARMLGYVDESGRSGAAARQLLRDYQRHTDGIREIYLRVLAVEEEDGDAGSQSGTRAP